MTPHQDRGQGTFLLDRRIGKLGRLKRASGTTDREEFAALNAMLTRLTRERRWDLLGLVQQHLVTPLELYDRIHRGETHLLPSAEELRSLPRSIEGWLRDADLADRTKEDYAKRLQFPAATRVAALPEILTAARVAAIQSGKRATFNNMLDAARAFVRDVLKPEHKLYRALPTALDVTRRAGNPQEPDQVRVLAQGWLHADSLWALCLTAMRRGEYWGTWDALSDRVQIQGVKGRRGVPLPRVVPMVYRPARPTVAYSTFYHQLVDRSEGALNVHDLRKTAQRWWEDAGIPDWRIRLYAGHARGGQELATIYRKPRDLTRLLVEDGERMRAWLGDPPKVGLRVASA